MDKNRLRIRMLVDGKEYIFNFSATIKMIEPINLNNINCDSKQAKQTLKEEHYKHCLLDICFNTYKPLEESDKHRLSYDNIISDLNQNNQFLMKRLNKPYYIGKFSNNNYDTTYNIQMIEFVKTEMNYIHIHYFKNIKLSFTHNYMYLYDTNYDINIKDYLLKETLTL